MKFKTILAIALAAITFSAGTSFAANDTSNSAAIADGPTDTVEAGPMSAFAQTGPEGSVDDQDITARHYPRHKGTVRKAPRKGSYINRLKRKFVRRMNRNARPAKRTNGGSGKRG